MQKESWANLLIAIFSIVLYAIIVVVFMLTNSVSSVFELSFSISLIILYIIGGLAVLIIPYLILKDTENFWTFAGGMMYLIVFLIMYYILRPIFVILDEQSYMINIINEFSFTNIYYLVLLGLCIIVLFLINANKIFTNNNFTFIRKISQFLLIIPYVIFFGISGVSLGCVMLISFLNLGSDVVSVLFHLYVGIFNIVLAIGLLLIPIGITAFFTERINNESKRDEEAFDI